ncbi:MAG: imidazolonepropionase [Motiliproteus sp.]
MSKQPIKVDRVWTNANLATLCPEIGTPYGRLEGHAIAVTGNQISWIGPNAEVDSCLRASETVDANGFWITPGLIDSHTHLIYGGNRCKDFEQLALGSSYEQIAQRGGGILSTVMATREMSEQQLAEQALVRLQALCAEGVTCIEIKSGYGLTVEDELKMLRAAKLLCQSINVHLRTSLLAAHIIPPEFKGRSNEYVELICKELIPQVAEQKLAQAVDVFCEDIAFDLPQTEKIFRAAEDHGLAIKAHVEQLSHLGGSALAASYKAWSVDHCEHLHASDIKALAASDTVVCLLPGAQYFLRQKHKPPVAKLRAAGVSMAVATDLNPGTSPFASLCLMMNMAVINFGLTPEEALTGVTRNAAAALGLGHRKGQLKLGYDADLLVWDINDPAQLSYEFGSLNLVQRVIASTTIPDTVNCPLAQKGV